MLQKNEKNCPFVGPPFCGASVQLNMLKSLNPPLCARINVREQMYNLTWESWRWEYRCRAAESCVSRRTVARWETEPADTSNLCTWPAFRSWTTNRTTTRTWSAAAGNTRDRPSSVTRRCLLPSRRNTANIPTVAWSPPNASIQPVRPMSHVRFYRAIMSHGAAR